MYPSKHAPQTELELSIHDSEFIQYCINEITEDGQLPFVLPLQAFPRIIRDCALWFYRECEDATQEKWYGIKLNELRVDESQNKTIRLPESIESIMEIKQVNSMNGFKQLSTFLREPVMYGAANNILGQGSNTMMGMGNPYRMGDRDIALEEAFTRMYEVSLMKTLCLKGIRFDYNPFSKILNFLGKVDSNIVLSTLTRIPLQSLYSDIRFRKYVVATSYVKLKKIVNQFDFTYPGNVKINYEEMESNGQAIIDKIEEQVIAESSAAEIILMK